MTHDIPAFMRRRAEHAPSGEHVAQFDMFPPAFVGKPAEQQLQRRSEDAIIARAMAILMRRMRGDRPTFCSPEAMKQWLVLHFAGEVHQEHFTVLFLDAQHRLIEARRMFTGTLTQTSVYPRDVVRVALELAAAGVVFSHNHPSGTTTPSRADEALTQTLKSALTLVDVRVHDHVIVAGAEALSFAQQGLL